MTNTPNQPPFITAPNERIAILDSLRGFAIFGILVVNIILFALPNHDFNQLNDTANHWYDAVSLYLQFFHEGKFYILFSFLFGIGFSVQINSLEKKNINVMAFYGRRLLILFVFGVLHSFLWWADILRIYALLGLVLLFLRHLSNKHLLILSAFSLLLSVLVSAFDEVFIYANAVGNADYVFKSIFILLTQQAPTAFAMFLLGRVAGQIGFFANLSAYQKNIKPMMIGGVIAGILFGGLALWLFDKTAWLASLFKTLSDMAFVSFFIGVFCSLSLHSTKKSYLKPFANVGKMALSNYVMQTLICVGFFAYFDLQGKMSMSALLLMTVSVFFIQIIISHYWLKYFQYGILEWVWRSMTFGKLQPLLK